MDFVKKTQLEITDWKLNPPFGEHHSSIFRNIESILSVRPLQITNVVGGAPTYGEEIEEGRYPVKISVDIELEIVINEPDYRFNSFKPKARAIVKPDMLDGKSPVSFEKETYKWKYIEVNKKITRGFTVFATLDAEKEKKGIFDDLQIEKVL